MLVGRDPQSSRAAFATLLDCAEASSSTKHVLTPVDLSSYTMGDGWPEMAHSAYLCPFRPPPQSSALR